MMAPPPDENCDESVETELDFNMTEEEAMAIWNRRNMELSGGNYNVRNDNECNIDSDANSSSVWSESNGYYGSDSESNESPSNSPGAGQHWSNGEETNDNEPVVYRPANQSGAAPFQRFINLQRPGLADAYVASTPEFAQLLEECRREKAQRALQQQRQQQQQALSAFQGHQVSGDTSDPIARQVLEYERLSEAHRQRNSSSNSANNEPGNHRRVPEKIDPYYLATRGPTETNIKQVNCGYCHHYLYTHPLAENFWCQSCAMITKLAKKDKEAQYEEKMQDREDCPGIHMNKQRESESVPNNVFCCFQATDRPTETNTEQVNCRYCFRYLYTNPLADSFWCDSCQRQNMLPKKSEEEPVEEHMQDIEGHQDIHMAY